jgi:hypothetical protein
VLPYEARVHAAAFAQPTRLGLVVGAVDNAPARRAIAASVAERSFSTAWGEGPRPILWLDAGNGRNGGQVCSATRFGPSNCDTPSTRLSGQHDHLEVRDRHDA